jgi:hypothetical protein
MLDENDLKKIKVQLDIILADGDDEVMEIYKNINTILPMDVDYLAKELKYVDLIEKLKTLIQLLAHHKDRDTEIEKYFDSSNEIISNFDNCLLTLTRITLLHTCDPNLSSIVIPPL